MPLLASLRVATGIAAAACVLLASVLEAQGIASAAVSGRVLSSAGLPIPAAELRLTSMSTGASRATTANARGHFGFENVPVGTYRLEARAIGSLPARLEGLVLHLGDRATRDVVLQSSDAPVLERIVVTDNPLRDAGAGGPASFVPGDAVRRLPLRDRNFLGLLAMAPQATGSGVPSVSGQHTRFNAIQVDGGSSGDFFGVNATPGLNAGAKVISLEALDEIRILVAPFDVRQGGFSGGLINAVTRSGTNEFRGAVFATHSRAALVGTDTAGTPIESFNLLQYGVRVGGPLVRNRVHFLAVADLQALEAPFVGPVAGDPTTGISVATAQRAARAFRERYGFDAGDDTPPVVTQPNRNLFAKLTWQPSMANWLELSHGRVEAHNDAFNRAVRDKSDRDGWQLSGSGSTGTHRSATTRLKLASTMRAFSNELIASLSVSRDRPRSRLDVPLFLVQGDLANTYLAGGSVKSAQGTETNQRILELTDNLSWASGAHVVTIGTQNQLIGIDNNFFPGSWGVWTFGNVDALERGEPFRYEVALPLPSRPEGPRVNYRAWQLAGYLQDRWQPMPGLTLTMGIRADIPFMDRPSTNAQLATNDALGRIDTGDIPSGNVQLAPRIGFAWELGAQRRTTVRGGIGAFTGHPIYVWLTTAFENTGLNQTLLTCGARNGVPLPTTDLTRLPTSCRNTSGAATAVPTISVFSPQLRHQQTIKYVLGMDRELSSGLVASLDIVHSRSRDQLYMRDANLQERGRNAEGRMMYGTFDQGGTARSTRRDTSFGPVYFFANRSADRSTAVATEVRKSWTGGGFLQAGYAWSRSRDLMNFNGFNGPIILNNSAVDGTLADRELRPSVRDIPHNFSASAVLPSPRGVTTSFFLRARSGSPYNWSVQGDANADNTTVNDLVYVPRDSSDVTLTNPQAYGALDRFIEDEPCLREQRGRIMTRGSCRNPMAVSLDASLSKRIGGATGRGVEVRADVFNLPNLMHGRWGLVRETSAAESKRGILDLRGWDSAANRPRYSVPSLNGEPVLPGREGVVVDASRWRMQLSMRYDF